MTLKPEEEVVHRSLGHRFKAGAGRGQPRTNPARAITPPLPSTALLPLLLVSKRPRFAQERVLDMKQIYSKGAKKGEGRFCPLEEVQVEESRRDGIWKSMLEFYKAKEI